MLIAGPVNVENATLSSYTSPVAHYYGGPPRGGGGGGGKKKKLYISQCSHNANFTYISSISLRTHLFTSNPEGFQYFLDFAIRGVGFTLIHTCYQSCLICNIAVLTMDTRCMVYSATTSNNEDITINKSIYFIKNL